MTAHVTELGEWPMTPEQQAAQDRYDAEVAYPRALCQRCGMLVYAHWMYPRPSCRQALHPDIEDYIDRRIAARVIAKLREGLDKKASGETMFWLRPSSTKLRFNIATSPKYEFGFTGFHVENGGECQYDGPLYLAEGYGVIEVALLAGSSTTDPNWLSPLLLDPPSVGVSQLHPLAWIQLTGRIHDPRRIDRAHMQRFRPTSKVSVCLFDGNQTRCTVQVDIAIPLQTSRPIDQVLLAVKRLQHSLPKRTEDCRFWADQQVRSLSGERVGRHYVDGLRTTTTLPWNELTLSTTTGYPRDAWTHWRTEGGHQLHSLLWTPRQLLTGASW